MEDSSKILTKKIVKETEQDFYNVILKMMFDEKTEFFANFLTSIEKMFVTSIHGFPVDTACITKHPTKIRVVMCFNPFFWKTLDTEEKIFLICHETMHIIEKAWLMQEVFQMDDSFVFNIAADLSINSQLEFYSRLKVIEGAMLPTHKAFSEYNLKSCQSSKYYYDILIKEKKKQEEEKEKEQKNQKGSKSEQKSEDESDEKSKDELEDKLENEADEKSKDESNEESGDKSGNEDGDGDGDESKDGDGDGDESGNGSGNGSGDGSGNGSGDGSGNGSGQNSLSSPNNNNSSNLPEVEDHKHWEPLKEMVKNSIMRDILEDMIENSIEIAINSTKNIGNLPLNVSNRIVSRSISHKTLSWKTLLKNFIAYKDIKSKKANKLKVNKRYSHFPGSNTIYKNKGVVLYDSSGSVSNTDLLKVFVELNTISKEGEVYYAPWDTECEDVKLYKKNVELHRTKAGGTDLNCALEYIKKNNKSYNWNYAVIITDGYIPLITEKTTIPTMIVIVPEGVKIPNTKIPQIFMKRSS